MAEVCVEAKRQGVYAEGYAPLPHVVVHATLTSLEEQHLCLFTCPDIVVPNRVRPKRLHSPV